MDFDVFTGTGVIHFYIRYSDTGILVSLHLFAVAEVHAPVRHSPVAQKEVAKEPETELEIGAQTRA